MRHTYYGYLYFYSILANGVLRLCYIEISVDLVNKFYPGFNAKTDFKRKTNEIKV